MRKLLVTVTLLIFSVTVFAADNPWNKKLPFKTATINYKMSGTMKGTKTIYVKDYGRTTAEYSDTAMKVFGVGKENKELIITTPEWVYTIDLKDASGSKQVNPTKYLIEEYNKLSKSDKKKLVKNAEKMGTSTIAGLNGTIEMNAVTILGYKCDKVTAMSTTAYTISGTDLALKLEGGALGVKIDEEATEIKKGNPPASKFNVPSNIAIEHNKQADQMMQAQATGIIQKLLSGEQSNNSAQPAPPTDEKLKGLTPEQKKKMKNVLKIFGTQ